MKVKLIQMTQNPIDVMWTAARTCYSAKSPIEMWNDRYFVEGELTEDEAIDNYNFKQEKMWNLVQKVIVSGHLSICEHCYFTFAIEGVSRTLLAQITRHRAGIVFSVMSQRYVEIKENLSELQNSIISPVSQKEKLKEIANKYFVDVTDDNYLGYLYSLREYLRATEKGIQAEDARMFLPNATKTNITMSINLRELMHVSNLRLCTRAQLEIRHLFQAIKKEVEVQDERLAELLVPSCEVHNVCFEDKCCGKRPKVNEVIKNYKT